jgi:autotransporter-associated beta strand protein
MNAYTRVSYFLGGAASDFLADIGVDEAADGFGFLVFRVYADGINIFDSGTVSNGTPTLPIDLDVTGKNILTLEASFASTPLQINGYADWANARIIVQPLPPAVPAGLAIAPAANQFTLSWYPSFGAATYNIKRSSAPGGPYATNANVSSTSFTDTNVTADTVYYYAVSAVNAYGESSNSTVVIGSPSYYWNDTVTASPQAWNLNQNWSNTSIFPNYSSTLAILNNYLLSNQTINLNQPITIGFLELGAISNSAAYTIAANGGSLSFYNNDNPVQITQLATSAGDTIAAPITLIGGLTVANNSTNLLTLSGNISTSASFTQAGPGPVLLAASNSFTAPYNVAQGKLIIGNKAALGITGTGVMVARNATLDVNGFNLGAAPVTVSGAGINGSGALISAAAAAQTNALQFVTLAGDTTIGGTTRWDLRGASNFIPSGALSTSGNPFNLVKTGTNQISLASINVDPALADIDVQQGVLSFESAATSMGNPTNTLSVESGATLAFTQTTTSWNKNIVLNGDGFATTISNNSGANTIVGPVTLNGGCLFGVPSGVLVLNGPVSGSGSLTKTLGGQLVIGGTNSWHGNTLVNAGTLAIANPSALAISPLITLASGAVLDAGTLPSGLSLVSHQTLGGSGSVSGNLTIGSGAMLSPANSFGIITFGNNLTLAPGSDTLLEVSPAPLTNDLVRVLGTLTYGGNLILTNLSSSPYAAGDAFQLFAAAASTGGEVRIFPETPGPSLVWDPSSLATTGVLRVIAGSTPQFTTAKLLGGRVSISGTGGVTNGTYYILSSTNCDLPAGQWTRIATNYFDANGNFSFTNSISLSVSATYYLLQLP